MNDKINIPDEDIEIINCEDCKYPFEESFDNMSYVSKPFVEGAKLSLEKIEEMLCKTPSFIEAIKSSVPESTLQAILTDEQKDKLAKGTLKLMTKKDGKMMANLINPKTKRIVEVIPLEEVEMTTGLLEAMNSYALQMQMAQIAEEIHLVQMAIEEVRQGQEFDRLAMAYSCQQKLLQAMQINNSQLKAMALMRIASDAEDSRNQLMLTQNANLKFIKEQPNDFFGKIMRGANPEKLNDRMMEIRDSLSAVNMVSLVEAIAYQELGESAAAGQSLQYYAEYLEKAYLSTKGLVERLDMIDEATDNYWSNTLPKIKEKIQSLPWAGDVSLLEGRRDGK